MYHIPTSGLGDPSNDQLEKWATDPNCIERDNAAAFLAERRAHGAKIMATRDEARAQKRAELQDNPFDSRTEVSADARHIANRIATHLWVIFVLLPIMLAVLWNALK